MISFAAVLAHQGGWDEMLYVAVPILLFVLLLRLANRRADRQASTRPDAADEEQPADEQPADPQPADPADRSSSAHRGRPGGL